MTLEDVIVLVPKFSFETCELKELDILIFVLFSELSASLSSCNVLSVLSSYSSVTVLSVVSLFNSSQDMSLGSELTEANDWVIDEAVNSLMSPGLRIPKLSSNSTEFRLLPVSSLSASDLLSHEETMSGVSGDPPPVSAVVILWTSLVSPPPETSEIIRPSKLNEPA